MARLSELQRKTARAALPEARAALAAAADRLDARQASPRARGRARGLERNITLLTPEGRVIDVPTDAVEAVRHAYGLQATGTDAPVGRLPYRDGD